MKPITAVKLAVDAAGGPAKVAAAFGITSQAVSQWVQCPDRRAIALERLCESKVTRHDLRPDLYPQDEAAA